MAQTMGNIASRRSLAMRAKSMKKTGHYCKICGEHKANEKFSGKGHAAHICKSCAAMPLEERNQAMTLARILNLPWYLSKEQYAWLKKRCHDDRPPIKEAAQQAYECRFPFEERNRQKKQYHVDHLSLMVNDDVYDEYGDEIFLNAIFRVSRKDSGRFVFHRLDRRLSHPNNSSNCIILFKSITRRRVSRLYTHALLFNNGVRNDVFPFLYVASLLIRCSSFYRCVFLAHIVGNSFGSTSQQKTPVQKIY